MIENKPLISVIVPVYKVEPYLEKCVRSIQNQTYRNLEIILVDDGSPDRCGEICDELAKEDKRIRIVHRENGGQSAARNSGLSIATGEYVGFVDSDDYIDEDMFDCLYSAMIKAGADLAMCNGRIVFPETLLKSNESVALGRVEIFTCNKAYDKIIPVLNNAVWNKLFRRKLLSGLLFPEGHIHGEDFIFLLNYLEKVKSLAVVSADKYNYLQRSGSITGSGFSDKKLDEIYSKDAIRKIISANYPRYEKIAEKWCFTARMNIIRGITLSGDTEKWKKNYKDCILYLKVNRKSVKKLLSFREKAESFVICFLPAAYSFLLKLTLQHRG